MSLSPTPFKKRDIPRGGQGAGWTPGPAACKGNKSLKSDCSLPQRVDQMPRGAQIGNRSSAQMLRQTASLLRQTFLCTYTCVGRFIPLEEASTKPMRSSQVMSHPSAFFFAPTTPVGNHFHQLVTPQEAFRSRCAEFSC